ncbi:tyrosine-protein kinase family protein [Mycobacterium neglectum]|uniref:tyrosine-protein kinase family protein n=1 Tax=Mycobacterium neglectum TaxID=242737 RepID=UPI000BFED4BE|nr:hypothetical protein [Mycobacterium neglectum]
MAVTLLAVLAASLLAMRTPTTYVGKSTLILSGRTPDQDSVLVIGYLTLFNDPATLSRLKTATDIPEAVTVGALTAGASPILTIEATADNPELAQDAAQKMAQAFSEDINAVPQAGREKRLDDLRNQLNAVSPTAPDGSTNPYYTSLLTEINEVRSESRNELLGLQPRAGVSENVPSKMFDVMSGAVGGLLLGVLVALGLGALSTRVNGPGDLRYRTEVEPLVEVPATGNEKRDKIRGERLRTLSNMVSLELSGAPEPSTVALADIGGREAWAIAEALAQLSAQRDFRPALVYLDGEAPRRGKATGSNDDLTELGLIRESPTDGGVDIFRILSVGTLASGRPSPVNRQRVAAILAQLRNVADTIVIVTPPIADSSQASILCAAADVTILVVSRGSAKTSDVESVAKALRKSPTRLLGAVLIDQSANDRRGSRFARSQVFDVSVGSVPADVNPRRRGQLSDTDRAAEVRA